MTKNYYKPNIGRFIEGYDFNNLMEDIGDHDKFVSSIIDYYFPNADKDKYFKNRESMMYIGKIIEKSGLGSNIKSQLFSFFIDPDEYIERFEAALVEKEKILREYYNRNSYVIDEWLQRYDSNEFFDELEFMIGSLEDSRTNKAKDMLSAAAGYSVGICLVNRYHVCVYQCSEVNENNTILMLGCNYKDGLEYEMSVYETIGLNGLGEVFSEPNRIAILDYMLGKDESSIKEIERELDISGSTAYYHLSIMLRNKMVRSRVKSRTVMYSINHEYFGYVSKLLGKYSEK